MSNGERQRKFRQRRDADQARRRENLLKSKEKYRKDKSAGKRKRIKDITERKRKRHLRNQKCKEKDILKCVMITPPSSPEIPGGQQLNSRQCYRDLKLKTKTYKLKD